MCSKRPMKSAVTNFLRGQYSSLNRDKRELIDFAFKRFQIGSFADLGGVWGVDGGYTFYALDKYKVQKAFLVDMTFTKAVIRKARKYQLLTLLNMEFGDQTVIHRLGQPDGILLFDVLLHQVNPNWDQVLEMYANVAKYILIYNPQLIASDETMRLVDLSEQEYFDNVPCTREEEPYKSAFDKMYEIHPQRRRMYRDIQDIWQWGIVDRDLIDRMTALDFTMQYYKNCGKFGRLKNFENHVFLFSK